MRAICSFSGGLDSILAVSLMRQQGIEVEAVHFDNGFGGCGERDSNRQPIRDRAARLGVKITFIDVSEDLVHILKDPKYGFGKNMNPCMDCHLLFFKKCGEYMRKAGASFIVTGEVVGERPMSQRKWAIEEISASSGLDGLILRPLSARLMKVTIPEKKGWVDREKLLAISGRSRKPQMELAKELGIDFYPNAAGGCLLTEKDFSRKVRDLMENKPGFDMTDVDLLKSGRHFRISRTAKLILGRDEKENETLVKNMPGKTYFMTIEVPGPVGVITGPLVGEEEKLVSRIISAYSDIHPGEEMTISRNTAKGGKAEIIKVKAVSRKDVKKYLV
jgi:tRNA-uridine 2-sulfurtransferase